MNLFILIPGQAVCQYNPASVPILTAAKNKECQRKVCCSSAYAGKEKLDDIAKTNVNADANGDALEGADSLRKASKTNGVALSRLLRLKARKWEYHRQVSWLQQRRKTILFNVKFCSASKAICMT